MARSHVLIMGVGLLATTVACHRNRPAVAPISTAARETPRASSDSLDRDRLERERAAQALRERERARAEAMRRELDLPIYFAFDTSSLSDSARARLDAKVPALAAGGATFRIVIEGHADERGSDEYNLALGQRRAAAAKRYLVARDIAPARIDIVSYGEERPACTTGGDGCRALNRRDEFRVVAGSIPVTQP